MKRCSWVPENDELYIHYHDNIWGVAVHDDEYLFKKLILEVFVAGLSWRCVLHKQRDFEKAFDDFDINKIIKYDDTKIEELANNPKIIRNRLKIKAAITNAKIFLDIQKEFGSFSNYIWGWTNNKIVESDGVETTSELSDNISKDLKKRGMKFVGSVMVFSYLCSVGIISAHQPECFLRNKN